MSLFRHLSPAMTQLIMLLLMAMMPGNTEAVLKVKELDKHLSEILGPFDRSSYVEGAEKFVITMTD